MNASDHIDQIMDIMGKAFDPTYGEAWTRRQIEDSFLLSNCYAYLSDEYGNELREDLPAAGFSLSRAGYEEEELLLFAVSPDFRRRGIGLSILQKLRSAAYKRGARRLLLEMRKENPAESLYRAFGFKIIGERKEYYRTAIGTRIDAQTFAYDIPSEF